MPPQHATRGLESPGRVGGLPEPATRAKTWEEQLITAFGEIPEIFREENV